MDVLGVGAGHGTVSAHLALALRRALAKQVGGVRAASLQGLTAPLLDTLRRGLVGPELRHGRVWDPDSIDKEPDKVRDAPNSVNESGASDLSVHVGCGGVS